MRGRKTEEKVAAAVFAMTEQETGSIAAHGTEGETQWHS
jgi:hypothetical protein